jgi:hypothetical protein
VTWSARIEHTSSGLALTFGAPLSRLDMAPDVAQHLASLLAVEARHRLQGVVAELSAPVELRPRDNVHPNCCDCEACLNGDHRGKTNE